ncbi:MAG TPA: protein translocase subunit SecD [Candidatus Acidoferrales bacterium]
MNPNLKWKALVILIVLGLCLYGLFFMPKFPPKNLADLKNNFRERIRLGLDLRGGSHLILQVQVDDAVNIHTDQTMDRMREEMRNRNLTYNEVRKLDLTHIQVLGIPPDQSSAFKDMVGDRFAEYDWAPTPGDSTSYTLSLKPTVVSQIRQDTLTQSIESIRRRVDALGVAEASIQERGRGDWEILVQLPGVDDPARVKSIMQETAMLEIRLVREPNPYGSEQEALAAHGGVLPEGTQVLRSVERVSGQTARSEAWYLANRIPVVTGRDLRSAKPSPSPEVPGKWDVDFTLSTEGARRFGPFTTANVGNPLAVVLDNKIQSVATIQSRIDDSGRITGNFTRDSANDLAIVLRAGALPASIKYLEERTVGPSLGADSIKQGFRASIVGVTVVMVFMVIYYRAAGINAIVALILNLLMLLAAMAAIDAVLTLPGIAGVILTVGMGVDSNVLIFERIREELRIGKAPVSAVEVGFNRVFITIVDTHVTTIVSAFFLYMFGSGPVRGFATTLVIGLVANVITSVWVSRVIFDWELGRMPRQAQLSI